MQGDDPPFLPVGTDVSAKYKGAFCEAKIKKVVRNIKCKVALKAGGSLTVNDDIIKGTLRVGSTVEVKQDPKKEAIEAVISKIQDCSQYTVVFDDGDITTLRRSALCLKSGRHFNESETLDQLPLTHPEHFSTPVIAGRRGRRGRAQSDESDSEIPVRPAVDSKEREPHVGRVVLVESSGGTERRRPQQPAFPALVVAPTAQIKVKEDYLVRSFKDGRYYTVPKKEAREFRKGGAPLEWAGVDAALQYLNNGVLPPHWDRDALFNEPPNSSDDSSDDEPREEKDHFVAQLYKFMDDRGTPLNRNPTIANRDIDLYRLFRVVHKQGGYNRVTNQNQWKSIARKMGFHPVTTSITNLCKQFYKKFLYSFEDFYRKLGVTLVAHPRGTRTPPSGRSLIRDRDKQLLNSSPVPTASATPLSSQRKDREKDSDKSETEKIEKDEKEVKIEKDTDKTRTEKVKALDKARASDGEDSADNQPLVGPSKTTEKDKEKDHKEKEKEQKEKEKAQKELEKDLKEKEQKEKERELKEKKLKEEKEKEKVQKEIEKHKDKERELKEKEQKEKEIKDKEKEIKDKEREQKERDIKVEKLKELKEREQDKPSEVKTRELVKSRSVSKTRSLPPVKTESLVDKRTPKPRRTLLSRGDGPLASASRASRRPHASTDSDSSGRASRCGLTKKMQSRRSQSANSASSGNTIASSNSSKRPRKRKITEPSSGTEPATRSLGGGPPVKADVGDKLKVYYGPTQSESKVTYEAKVIEKSSNGMLRVHYTGWNTRYDEWIKPQRIALNVSQHERTHSKKGIGGSRRSRAKRTEDTPQSDTDSDSDSEVDVKRPPKKIDDKSLCKSSLKIKDSKSSDSSSSSKSRKRPIRSVTTPPAVSPVKKPRHNVTHQGRDYDLNEIRSELKGLHTVKQEPEEIKAEVKESPPPEPAEPPQQQEKQAEDVYEFKEPEPFEIELHDEKKKRTHRIFDDISPSKYTSTLSKSLSEEIAEDPLRPRPTMRSPSLSPFREFPRDAPGHQTPEDDSKDGIYSMDDDSLHGEGSSGPIFEGFTPAKNQETYSKKRNVLKLRELIDDSPDSPADDEQSSEDEPETKRLATDSESSQLPACSKEQSKVTDKTNKPDKTKEDIDKPVETKPITPVKEIIKPENESPKMPKSPILTVFVKGDQGHEDDDIDDEEMPIISIKTSSIPLPSAMKVANIPLPKTEPKEDQKFKLDSFIEKKIETKEETEISPTPDSPDELEVPSSPLIDTEEEKSEPDSPVRLDILPDPPPGFLLHSEGPKIAEKLLEAINSAKRLCSPPPKEENPKSPKKESPKVIKSTDKNSPPSIDVKAKLDIKPKLDLTKNIFTKEVSKLITKTEAKKDNDIGECSNVADIKLPLEPKKKSKEISPPRLHSPLSILAERRKSFVDLPLPMPNKNTKVLSDTIQKLSSQINQSVANIPLPPFHPPSQCDSSDSDDTDRRLVIDKIPLNDWSSINRASSLHAGKSAGEWSAGESLLMLEDACKNQRKHSANVVVAGSGLPRTAVAVAGCSGVVEDESNISLLLCSETIPGSPAAEAEPPPPRPQGQKHVPSHNDRGAVAGAGASGVGGGGVGAGGGGVGAGGGPPRARWARLADTTPPTTPDSSLDMSPLRERRMSERDSPSDRKEDDEDRQNDGSGTDGDKPTHGRSRMLSESSHGAARGRRRRRDTDERRLPHTPLNYNFYVELDPLWDCETRINILTSRLADLRKAYHSVKADLAAIDRRRKKLRRKEREAVKAAKAACS